MGGATVRWAVDGLVPNSRFHLGTLIVNCLGSFLLGVLAETFRRSERGRSNVGLALMTGFCGSLTTFSALAVAVAAGLQDGDIGTAGAVVALNCALGVGLAVLGVKARQGFA